MIITLKGASFKSKADGGKGNIGVLDTYYRITVNEISGASVSLDKTLVLITDGASTTVTGTVTVDEGYNLTSVTIEMGGADISDCYDSDTGAIKIEGVTGNIVITLSAEAKPIADFIVDPWACWGSGQESATSGYYSVVDYPVESGATYSIPYGRNYFFEDSSHTYISGGGGAGASDLQITTPSNAAYITICFKPDEISADAVTITKV